MVLASVAGARGDPGLGSAASFALGADERPELGS